MNNRFTEPAQQAIQQAHEILQQKQHTQLDVEHILLALLRQPDSTVARILQQMNTDREYLAAEVDKTLSNIPRSYGANYSGGLQIYDYHAGEAPVRGCR
jgi:ATP-dependent Clp protease ATP-binding subunit ClpC